MVTSEWVSESFDSFIETQAGCSSCFFFLYSVSLTGSSGGHRDGKYAALQNSPTHQPVKSPTPPTHSLDPLSREEQGSRDWVQLNKNLRRSSLCAWFLLHVGMGL